MARKKAAKKATEKVGKDVKMAFVAKNKSKFSSPKEANAALQKEFGSGLLLGHVAQAMGRKRKTPAKKRGKVGRPLGSGSGGSGSAAGAKKPGRRGRRPAGVESGGTDAPAYIVATPGRGRGWNLTHCGSREEAIALANEALGRGVAASRVGIYAAEDFEVKSAPTVSL